MKRKSKYLLISKGLRLLAFVFDAERLVAAVVVLVRAVVLLVLLGVIVIGGVWVSRLVGFAAGLEIVDDIRVLLSEQIRLSALVFAVQDAI